MGRLTTHVLDTAHGAPAAGMTVRLFRCDGARQLVGSFSTNQDGRLDAPLLDDAAFRPGQYALEFDVADYFRARDVELPTPPFLDTVTLDVGLGTDDHYHVPLLVSPWSYSTYRGS
jgi:5-hydroxyisourate hydrolase